jgi:RecQ mediated genome instability protein
LNAAIVIVIYLDLAEPFYEQWRRLHNIKLDEVQEFKESKAYQSKKKRCFKLELTDGHKTIVAMEYKPIACLTTKLSPGVKILITGPVQVVNKILHIGPEQVKIIGGELDEILITNAYENVLLRMLKKPTTNEPVKNYVEEVFTDQCDIVSSSNRGVKPPVVNNQVASNDAVIIDDENDDFIDLDMIDAIEQQECLRNQPQQQDVILDDDIDDDILQQIELEEAKYRESLQSSPKKASKACELLIPAASSYSRDSSEDEIPLSPGRKEKRKSSPIIVGSNLLQPLSKIARISPIKKPTLFDDHYPFKIEDQFNFLTIDQYLSLKMLERVKKVYAILGKIETIKKFTVTVNEWNFLVELRDSFSKNSLPIKFADDVVTGFTRRTAAEMNLLREKIKTQPQLKEDIAEIIQRVNDCTQSKTFLMCVSLKLISAIDQVYVVTRIIDQSDDCKNVIEAKIREEGLLKK